MKLSAPKVITFWVAVALAVLGFLGAQGMIASLSASAFWLVMAGFIILALGNLMKDL